MLNQFSSTMAAGQFLHAAMNCAMVYLANGSGAASPVFLFKKWPGKEDRSATLYLQCRQNRGRAVHRGHRAPKACRESQAVAVIPLSIKAIYKKALGNENYRR
jgi:hypothetical protein